MEFDQLVDTGCYEKARSRGQMTFTVVGQDRSTPTVICEWIKQNIETCPADKLRHALEAAIAARETSCRKIAD